MSSLLKNSNNRRPVISICIPTFNRAVSLEKLLENLYEIKMSHGKDIEICISNNQSTDETLQVIESWTARLELKVITQSENIGATLNFLAVTNITSGRWLMIVGDDDVLIPNNFAKLLIYLLSANEHDWILAGVADISGKESLLGNLKYGRYTSSLFKKTILRTGLYRYGFIGMHIFPSVLQQEFVNLTFEQAQPWPHLALFLRHIQHGCVRVFTSPVVQQAGGGAVLFWNINDMAYIKLRKLNIIAEARKAIEADGCFFDMLLIRELYLARDARTLVFWKTLEPNDFNQKALREYFSRYALIRAPYIFFAALHCIFLLAVYIAPSYLMYFLLCVVGQRAAMDAYKMKKQVMGEFNGVKRGL